MTEKKLLIPDTVKRELHAMVDVKPKRTPVCPACGAKFQHDKGRLSCKVCGLPDEIRNMGPAVIARWKKRNHVGKLLRELRGDKTIIGGSAGRKRKKHGRQT